MEQADVTAKVCNRIDQRFCRPVTGGEYQKVIARDPNPGSQNQGKGEDTVTK